MPPRSDVVFIQGLDFFSEVVSRLAPSDWDRPSPCAGWTALDVLGHVGAAVRFGATLLRDGEATWKPTNLPGQAVEGDPAHWWAEIAASAKATVAGVDLSRVVDAPRGPRSVGEGLSFPALDLFVHGWDLARSAGIDISIPDEVTEFGHALLDAMPASQLRTAAVFAGEAEVPEGASASEAFIAWTGRDPRWAP
jgi:uncharacterized protein (TIGR03086 family)